MTEIGKLEVCTNRIKQGYGKVAHIWMQLIFKFLTLFLTYISVEAFDWFIK